MSTHEPNYLHASWLENGYRIPQLREAIARAAEVVRDIEFDAFAARGVSGLLFLTPFAIAMNKTIIVVRKEHDDTHSSNRVEGDQAAKRYIIVDDFLSSGKTAWNIITEIKHFAPKAKCLGVLEVNRLFEEAFIDVRGYAVREDNKITTLLMDKLELKFAPKPSQTSVNTQVAHDLECSEPVPVLPVDDFLCTGKTVWNIMKEITQFAPQAECHTQVAHDLECSEPASGLTVAAIRRIKSQLDDIPF